MENEKNINDNKNREIEVAVSIKKHNGILMTVCGVVLFFLAFVLDEDWAIYTSCIWGGIFFLGIFMILEANKLKKNSQLFPIRGWLIFFVCTLWGFICGKILTMIIQYNVGSDLASFEEICITFIAKIALPIYVIVAFFNAKPNAVFIGKAYLILNIISFLVKYFVGFYINTISFVIACCFSMVWFVYLTYSEQVKDLFSIKERIVYKRDMIIVTIVFLIIVIPDAIYFNQRDKEENRNYPIGLDEIQDSSSLDIETESPEISKSLNDIRFGDWTDEDWLDNEYYRFLRKCFDDYYNGIENENTSILQEYKSSLNNQFFIYSVDPFLMGGLFITLGFLDNPQTLYETVVYSDVDEKTETITEYRLEGFRKSKATSSFTKEELIEIFKNHPENKLW